jgi:hypothetical protein
MTEIMINSAPLKFQPYFRKADEKSDCPPCKCGWNNGRIDCDREAQAAYDFYTDEHPGWGGEIMAYLEAQGFRISVPGEDRKPIEIGAAKIEYREQMAVADRENRGRDGGNGRIDTDDELQSFFNAYEKDHPAKVNELAGDMDVHAMKVTGAERRLRLMVTPAFSLGSVRYNYANFPEAMRLVPPAPESYPPGLQNQPVEYRGKSTRPTDALSLKFTLDLFQYLTLNYTLLYSIGYKAGPGQEETENSIAGIKRRNPTNRIDGADATTFISFDKGGTSQVYTVGVYPLLAKVRSFDSSIGEAVTSGGWEYGLVVEAGAAKNNYAAYNGWDRFYYSPLTTAYEKQPLSRWGFAGGINFQMLGLGDPAKPGLVGGVGCGVNFELYPHGEYAVRANLISVPFGLEF